MMDPKYKQMHDKLKIGTKVYYNWVFGEKIGVVDKIMEDFAHVRWIEGYSSNEIQGVHISNLKIIEEEFDALPIITKIFKSRMITMYITDLNKKLSFMDKLKFLFGDNTKMQKLGLRFIED